MQEEKTWIEWIRKKNSGKKLGVDLGIGDDAAVLRFSKRCIATVDCVVEGVHFKKEYATPEDVGVKALAVNLSDCAAMAAKPRYALVSLGLPPGEAARFLPGFYKGLLSTAKRFNTALVGGNLSRSRQIFADVVLLAEADHPVRRDGARPGDWVFLLGAVGESAAGLQLLLRHGRAATRRWPALCRAQLRPTPRVAEGLKLAGLATSLIDVSDGLVNELGHLAKASGVRLEYDSRRVPLSARLRQACQPLRRDPLKLALTGGEDYALLFTAPAKAAGRLNAWFGKHCVAIGRVGRGRAGVVDVTGNTTGWEAAFSHF